MMDEVMDFAANQIGRLETLDKVYQKTVNPYGLTVDESRDKLALWRDLYSENTSPNSLRSFESDIKQFNKIAEILSITALPLSPGNTILVLSYMAEVQKKKYSTIQRMCSSINKLHHAAGFYKPMALSEAQMKLSGIRRQLGSRQKQAEAMSVNHLNKIIRECLKDGSIRSIRDACVASFLYDSWLRRTDICGITFDDIYVDIDEEATEDEIESQKLPFGLGSHLFPDAAIRGALLIKKSKTDQDGKGEYSFLSGTSIRLYLHMCERLGLRQNDQEYVFRSISTGGVVADDPMSDNAVYRTMLRVSKYAGENVRFTGHSGRVGGCVDAAKYMNCNLADLQNMGRWKSPAMPAHYTRKITVFERDHARFRNSQKFSINK